MPGDALDLSWVYKHAKGHVLILSRLVEMSVTVSAMFYVRDGTYFISTLYVRVKQTHASCIKLSLFYCSH